ncbi:MAG: GYD domain-containing protein [Candidatus Marinimicrobia bacterium]|nr:GYD domain-containing protein [Candidatus Neomarinimicrobiota bacterium]
MITCFMFGTYSGPSLNDVSPDRTKEAVTQIGELGGEVKSMYALLGTHDLVLIVNFPDISQALKASVLLTRRLGIQFSTHPAVTVEEFDALMSEM